MSPELEMYAWAAGFFEGEGCVSKGREKGAGVQLVLVNTDLERLRLFVEILGCGEIRPRPTDPSSSLKQQYVWQVYSETAVAAFRLMEPWLGSRRRARFDEIVSARVEHIAHATRPRLCEWCKVEFTPKWSSQAARHRFCTPACVQRARPKRRRRVRDVDVQALLDENVVTA